MPSCRRASGAEVLPEGLVSSYRLEEYNIHVYIYIYLAGGSLPRIGLEETPDEVLRIVTNILPVFRMEDDLLIAALLDELRHGFAAEWRIAAEKGVGDDTERPHIHRLAMALLLHDLWRSIAK
jgi:hypothetical protein